MTFASKHQLLQRTLLALILLFGHASVAAADDSSPKRPKIALVLEGGGAKGFAHVGVLKVLEERHVPVDFVVGTSMGSIVGAAYASGRTVEEMEQVLSSTDWDGLFNETPPRREVHYRQKSGRDRELFGDTKIGIKDGEIVTPLALVQGQNVEPVLQRLFGKVPSNARYDSLPIPYRAVAADIETGEAVVLDHGNLATAARASMSVPGFFTPVEIEGRVLVDGGITNNLPVDVALAAGADVIIAVECKDHLRTRDKLNGPLAISGQIVDMLLERSTQNALKLLRPQDIHVSIELGEYGSTSFGEASKIMELGAEKARTMLAQFDRLSVGASEYARYVQHRTGSPEFAPVIDYVQIDGATGYSEAELKKTFEKFVGQPLDRVAVEEKLTAAAQSGDYQKVTYDLVQQDNKTGLVVRTVKKEWLKKFARLGFAIEDDFEGGSNYNLALETRMNDINAYGGYLDVQLETGKSPQLGVELYQPIFEASRFFVAPEINISKQQILLRDGDDITADYQRYEETLALKSGYSLGKYGEVSAGWRWGLGDIERRIEDPALANFDYDIGEFFTRLSLDQFDNPDFPTEGYRIGVIGIASRDELGADDNFERATASVGVPISFGPNTILLNAEAGFAPSDLPVERYSSLGGFFDISGFEQRSLIASDFWVYRTAIYRRISEGGSSLFPLGGYVGLTGEYASLRSSVAGIPDRPSIVAGSVFIGADTPLLPVYLGYGISDESQSSIYFTVGRIPGRRR
ncbi:MAG: patatin-like phospholipase family protein [Bdellovibrionota bacterium]